MSDNVIPFGGLTTNDLPLESFLDAAKDTLDGYTIIVGWDKDGKLFLGSNFADAGEILWLLAKAQQALLEE